MLSFFYIYASSFFHMLRAFLRFARRRHAMLLPLTPYDCHEFSLARDFRAARKKSMMREISPFFQRRKR